MLVWDDELRTSLQFVMSVWRPAIQLGRLRRALQRLLLAVRLQPCPTESKRFVLCRDLTGRLGLADGL